jgi:hypothetical protein
MGADRGRTGEQDGQAGDQPQGVTGVPGQGQDLVHGVAAEGGSSRSRPWA